MVKSGNFRGPMLPPSDLPVSEPPGRLPKACNALWTPKPRTHMAPKAEHFIVCGHVPFLQLKPQREGAA